MAAISPSHNEKEEESACYLHTMDSIYTTVHAAHPKRKPNKTEAQLEWWCQNSIFEVQSLDSNLLLSGLTIFQGRGALQADELLKNLSVETWKLRMSLIMQRNFNFSKTLHSYIHSSFILSHLISYYIFPVCCS